MADAVVDAPHVRTRSIARTPRWFYPAAGLAFVVLTVAGFKLFYFKGLSHPGREIPPPIRTLVITHGVLMSSWIVLFVIQASLIALKRHRLHMAVGKAGVVLAAVALATGVWVAVQSARVTPPEVVIWGLNPTRFLAIPLTTILTFGAFAGVGIWKRRRPAVHKACMLMATLAALGAAVSRIDVLSNLYIGTIWEQLFGPFLFNVVFAGAIAGARCALGKVIDRPLVIGAAVVTLVSVLTMVIAKTPAWESIAAAVVS